MSFTQSNIPLWSGNGTELTNGINPSTLSGTGAGSVGFITSGTPTVSATYVISNIPTTYKHLWLNCKDILVGTGSPYLKLELSTDGGSTYAVYKNILSTLSSSVVGNSKVNIYNSGFSNTSKYIITLALAGNGYSLMNSHQIEIVKTGFVNTLRLSPSTSSFQATGTITLYGLN